MACLVAAWLGAAALGAATPGLAVDRVALVNEFVTDADSPPGRPDFYVDPILFAARGRVHAALDVGNFGRGLEVGWTQRDRRRSSYVAMVRRRQGGALDDTAFELGTNQVLGRPSHHVLGRVVAQAALRLQWPDHPDGDNLLFIPSLGGEVYTGSWSFASFRGILDPRPRAGVTFMLAHRLASEYGFVEVMAMPRTDGVFNYGIRGRWRWLVAGYAREQDFDYSRIDRRVWSLGIQYDLGS